MARSWYFSRYKAFRMIARRTYSGKSAGRYHDNQNNYQSLNLSMRMHYKYKSFRRNNKLFTQFF